MTVNLTRIYTRLGDRGEVAQMPQLHCLRRPCRLGQPYQLRLRVCHGQSLRPSEDALPNRGPTGQAAAPLKALMSTLVTPR